MVNIYHFLKKHLGLELDVNNPDFIYIFLISALLPSLLLGAAVSNIIMILLVIFTFYNAISKKIKPHFQTISYWFFALYLWMLLSWFWSIDKSLTMIGLQRNSTYFLIPFIFAFFPKSDTKKTDFVIRFFSIAMVVYALYFLIVGIIHWLKTGNLEQITHHWLVSPLNLNRVLVSIYMVTALFYWIFKKEKTFLKFFSIGILFVITLLLSSKTIIISTLLILSVIIFYKLKQTKFFGLKYLLILPVFPIIIYASSILNKKFISEMNPRVHEILYSQNFGPGYYFNGAELRLLYTRFLFEFNKEEPVFFTGYGLDASKVKINEKIIQYNIYPGYIKYHFHNQFNQNMADLGIFGLLLVLFILYLTIKSAFRQKQYFLLSFLIIFSMYCITDTPLRYQRGIYLFFFLIFLFQNNIKTENNYQPLNNNKTLKSL